MVRLLHFSDIHFNKENGVDDENIEVKDAIEKDLKILMNADSTKIDYILICGDIAFSGKSEEYANAATWLSTICELTNCNPSSVLVVPGNHDVDRSKVKECYIQTLLHENLKQLDTANLDRAFSNLVKNKHIDILKQSQANYNEFASRFDCNFKDNKLFWELEHSNFNKFKLKFRGCNSALLSDEMDKTLPQKMALSKHQYYIKDEYNTIYITLCHHPVEYLIDKDLVESSFDSKVALQLFGHNHNFHVEPKEKSVIIHAGAIKPEVEEDSCYPCYNIIDIDIEENKEGALFVVKVWIREWDGHKFTPGAEDGQIYSKYSIPILTENPWQKLIDEPEILAIINKPIGTDKGKKEYTERDVRYKFLSLPFYSRRRLGQNMIKDSFSDSQLSEMERSLNFLNEIKNKGLYNELWDNLTNQH